MNDRKNPSDYEGQTITDDSQNGEEREKPTGMDGEQLDDPGRAEDSDDDAGENIDESDD